MTQQAATDATQARATLTADEPAGRDRFRSRMRAGNEDPGRRSGGSPQTRSVTARGPLY